MTTSTGRRSWALPVVGGVMAAVVLVATNRPGRVPGSPLDDAVTACRLFTSSYVEVLDGDHTLTIDGKGEADQGLHAQSIACLLDQVGATDAVVDRMDHTRALDGMQDAAWGDYKASWTFHPDDGLDVRITWGER